jgi:hypothetical protein
MSWWSKHWRTVLAAAAGIGMTIAGAVTANPVLAGAGAALAGGALGIPVGAVSERRRTNGVDKHDGS